MAVIRFYAQVAVFLAVAGSARGAGPLTLRESARVGSTTRAEVRLKAEGLYREAAPPGAKPEAAPKSLTLKVETRLEFVEKIVALDPSGRPARAARRVVRAGTAVNGEVRPLSATVRPAVAVLVAEPRAEGVVVYSPSGPLTRSELELVQGPGDPLALEGLLPVRPVEPGDRWKVGDAAARALSGYDTLHSNGLEATLESADDAKATVRLKGDVRGSSLGGDGTMAVAGSYTFDRKASRVASVTVDRAETRSPGPVEAGLDVKGTLAVTRGDAEAPPELADDVLSRLPAPGSDPNRARERLLLPAAAGRYTLEHDRDWHLYWENDRLTVLKRIDRGSAVAQCNLSVGPSAGRGRHQDLGQFRDDVKKVLGGRFAQFLGAGEVEGDPAGHFRYKVGVQGREGDVPVVWYYYLVASPEGDQVVATFTLTGDQARVLGPEDERLMATFRWTPRPASGGAETKN